MKHLLIALVLVGLAVVGCRGSKERVLGQRPSREVKTILAVRAGDTAPEVVLCGEMVEKCPVAGCWFRLKDSTGIIKVDTKMAGFVVVDVPLETKMVVAGKIIESGDEVLLEASGLRY